MVYLSDLARKDPRVHKYKSYLYLYHVLTIALFYGLPAIQLVITYQRVLNETGQQDLCYYNFLCAHPLGVISDFNHLFSNIGYISFGILFLWITYRREITHKDLDFDRVNLNSLFLRNFDVCLFRTKAIRNPSTLRHVLRHGGGFNHGRGVIGELPHLPQHSQLPIR